MNKKNNKSSVLFILIIILLFLTPFFLKKMNSKDFENEVLNSTTYENRIDNSANIENVVESKESIQSKLDLNDIPSYSGSPYVSINNNVPYFEESDLITKSYETYGSLDSLGRCTSAIACIGKDLMPTEKRESISKVKPTRMACYKI